MAHKSLRTLIKEADTFAGAVDRVPRVLVANKCDKLASDNDEARSQLEQARAWAQRAGLAFLECSASAPYNVDALFVLVATYLGQIATLPRSVPRWFAPRWGRTTAGKWLAERRIVGSFVVYPWFWRRKQSQHDAACSHSGSAGFELAEIVVGNNGELFVQHKSIAVSRVLPPAGFVEPDPARRSPIVLRFVLSGQKRGFPSMTAIILCHKLLRLDAYRLSPLAVPPPDPKDYYAGAIAASSGGGNTLSRVKKSLLQRMGSRTRSEPASPVAGGAPAPASPQAGAAAAAAAPAEPVMSPADAADQPALLEGEMRVQTQTVSKKSGWKRRYVSILRDRLCIYSSEKDRTRRAVPVEMLKLIDCQVVLVTAAERDQLELTLPGAPSKRVFRSVSDDHDVMVHWCDVMKRTVAALGTLDVDTPMPEPDAAPAARDDNADAEGDTGSGGGKAQQRSFFDLPAGNDDNDDDAAAYEAVVPLAAAKPAAVTVAADEVVVSLKPTADTAGGAAAAAAATPDDVVVVVDDDVTSSSTASSVDEMAFADAIESSNGSNVELMPGDAVVRHSNSGAASDDELDDDDDDDDDDDASKNDDRGKMKKEASDVAAQYVVLSAAPQADASDSDAENGGDSPTAAAAADKRFWSEAKTPVAPTAQADVEFDANNPFSAALARNNSEARKAPGLDADRMRAARFLTSAGYGAGPALRALQEANGNVEGAVQILVKWAIEGQVVGKAVDGETVEAAAAAAASTSSAAPTAAPAPTTTSAPASPAPAQSNASVVVSPVAAAAPAKPERSAAAVVDDEASRQREADEANILAAKHAAALAANEDLIKQTYARRKTMLAENARQSNMPLPEFVRLIEYEAQQVAFALASERHRFDTNQLMAANERQRAQLKHLLASGGAANGNNGGGGDVVKKSATPTVERSEPLAEAAKRFSLPVVAADQLSSLPGASAATAPVSMNAVRALSLAIWRDVPVGVLAPSDDDLKSDKSAALASLEREAVLLCRLRHPHIVALLAIRTGGVPGLIVPLNRSTTLEALFAIPTALTTMLSRLRVARCVARALVYLHYVCKPPIVHRNVRPSSILCLATAPHEAKLAGFEYAQPVAGESVPFLLDDTPRWTAPELLNESAYDGRVDVYSFGILLWQLLANRLPFGDADSNRSVRARIQSGVRPDPALMIDKIEAAAAAANRLAGGANGGGGAGGGGGGAGGGGTMSIGGTSALAGLAARAWSAHADQRPTMGDVAKVLASVCAGVEKKEAQQEEDRQLCSVCLDQPRCMAFVPCGHVATCETCSRDLRGHPCVICFAQSSASIKVFL
jgi:hypothetical protein